MQCTGEILQKGSEWLVIKRPRSMRGATFARSLAELPCHNMAPRTAEVYPRFCEARVNMPN